MIKIVKPWLSKCRTILFDCKNIEEISEIICRTAIDEGAFDLAWYGQQSLHTAKVLPIHVFPPKTPFYDSDGFDVSSLPKSPSAMAWKQSRIFVVNQIDSDINFDEWQSMTNMLGYRTVIAIPLIPKFHPKGILVFYSRKSNCISRELRSALEDFSIFFSHTLSTLAEKASQKKEINILTKQEEMYRSVFENTGTGTIIIDYDMTIMHANAKFLSMVGHRRDEVENRMKWSQFVAPQDNERMQRYHFGRRQKKTGIPTDYQCRIIDRHGRLKYIDMQVGMIPDSMHSIASFMDITKRKLAEDQLKENESRLSAIIETFDNYIYISDTAHKILFMNKALRERVGNYAPTSHCYKVVHGLDKPCKWCVHAEVVSEGPIKKEIKSPFDNRWYSLTATPVRQIDGKVERLQTILIDITERKLAEKALAQKANVLSDENRRLKSAIKERYKFGEIIGKSSAMQSVYEMIVKAATSDDHVIIQGESGTGKELVASEIHKLSNRKSRGFIPVNCGAISESIIESEFFGYKQGAFTGAHRDKPGFLDIADKGTLFLDEIGEIGLNIQVKLLRAIEGGGYTPVGDRMVRYPSLRIVAATNRNLRKLVKQGKMREDFFYRIHVIPIHLPPLRERKEDLPLLIDHFISKFSPTQPRPSRISGNMLEAFLRYSWPGNIRELENIIKRYAAIGSLDFFHALISSPEAQLPAKQSPIPEISNELTLQESLALAEKTIIIKTLETFRWQKGQAAEALGIHRKTLFTKMKKHGIK